MTTREWVVSLRSERWGRCWRTRCSPWWISYLLDNSPSPNHWSHVGQYDHWYSNTQKDFLCRILDRHPNIVTTMGELRDARMQSDQFGPIHHICELIQGLACPLCDYAAPNNPSKRTFCDHWCAHGLPQAASKRKRTWAQLYFYVDCQIQLMDHDNVYALWLAVPSNTSKETGHHTAPLQSFGSLLAGKLCADWSIPSKLNR